MERRTTLWTWDSTSSSAMPLYCSSRMRAGAGIAICSEYHSTVLSRICGAEPSFGCNSDEAMA